MKNSLSLVLVGVGGQGILTVSEILGSAAISDGLDAVMSEVHGMAQRGGVVTTQMKIGGGKSPLVGDGEADIILGFEPAETYRILSKASLSSYVITNVEPLVPPSVSLGMAEYPEVEKILENIRKVTDRLIPIQAVELAKKAGSILAGNIVMLGAMIALDDFIIKRESIYDAMRKKIAPRYLDMNLKALELGYDAAREMINS